MIRFEVLILVCLVLIAACSPGQELINRDGESASDTTSAPVRTEVLSPTRLPPTAPVSTANESETDATSAPAPIEVASPTSLAPTAPAPFALDSIIPGQEMAYTFLSTSGEVIHYWLYIPEGYDESRSWPLIIALHGNLGSEPNLDKVRQQSPTAFIGSQVNFPFIVISPRGPTAPWDIYQEPIEELIGHLGESLSIDSKDQFLTGLSTGGVGAWQWALAFPNRFSGIALIAGPPTSPLFELDPDDTCKIKDLPIWIGHSEADKLAPIESTRAAVRALEDCGSKNVTFMMYTDLNHGESFATAFAGPDLYDWMLALINDQ